MNIFKKKDFQSVKEAGAKSKLVKTLTAFDLVMLGLGGVVGAGVFVLTGKMAANYAGPAVMLSYAIAGITCIFVALTYTELVSMLPTSGSLYTYSFVAFGELIAWLAGGVIFLEFTISAAAVAKSWSGYMQGLLYEGGMEIPRIYGSVPSDGGIIDLPAAFISLCMIAVLYRGTSESKKLNALLVMIKLIAVAAFVFAAVPHFNVEHWENFMPFGFNNVFLAGSILFFAFTGFSAVAASAEEAKNPEKDVTIGLIGSLVIATLIYIVVAGLLTGIVSYTELNNTSSLATALSSNGSSFGSAIVAAGASCGMVTVIMANLYVQSRIAYAMSRDGLYPKIFSKVHKKYSSPHFAIMFFGFIITLLAAFCPFDILGQLPSMAALADYLLITIIVIIFRSRYAGEKRTFMCPVLWFVAPVSIIMCVYLFSTQVYHEGEWLFQGKVFASICFLNMLGYFVMKMFKK